MGICRRKEGMGMDAEGRRGGGKGKENSALVSTEEKEKSRHLTHSLPPNISLSTVHPEEGQRRWRGGRR